VLDVPAIEPLPKNMHSITFGPSQAQPLSLQGLVVFMVQAYLQQLWFKTFEHVSFGKNRFSSDGIFQHSHFMTQPYETFCSAWLIAPRVPKL